jgi:hypothetical protein
MRVGPSFELTSHLIQAVRAGIGIGLVPKVLVEDELTRHELVPIGDAITSRRSYYLVYPPENETLPSLAAFREWLLKRADQMTTTRAARAGAPFDLPVEVVARRRAARAAREPPCGRRPAHATDASRPLSDAIFVTFVLRMLDAVTRGGRRFIAAAHRVRSTVRRPPGSAALRTTVRNPRQ